MDTKEPFRLLSNKEFAKLSREEKIAYLKAAIEAVKSDAPIVGIGATQYSDPDDGGQ